MRYLKELSEIPGVSGDEMRIREFIREKIIGKVDELFIDNLGNLIAFKKGKRKNRSKVMVLAHMDEVGFMVTRLNEDGTLSFLPVGGVKPEILPGKRVKVVREGVHGVIGFKAVHLQKEDEMNKLPRWDDLRIDAGFESKDEAEKNVKIGDYVCFDYPFEDLGNMVLGKAFDDRGGCSLLLDLILQNDNFENDVHFVFTVQEEVGLRGSGVVMESIDVDVALVIEVTATGDEPSMKDRKSTVVGEGPAITTAHRGYVVPRKVLEWIISTAESGRIKYQFRRRTIGATDALSIATRKSGTPCGVISIPARYIHGPSSLMSKEDYSETFKLLLTLLNSEFS